MRAAVWAARSEVELHLRNRRTNRSMMVKLDPYEIRGLHHGPQLLKRYLSRQVFHAAVRCEHQPFRLDVFERGADSLSNLIHVLDFRVGQVEHTNDHRLRRKAAEEREV